MKFRFVLPVIFTVGIICVFYFTRIFVFKYYPVCMNFLFFIIFFLSLFAKETVIQRIARTMDGGLTVFSRVYTKRLTYIWCVFLFLNFCVSLITVFMSDRVWMIYNGCVSYILVGTFFVVEYIVRLFLRQKYDK